MNPEMRPALAGKRTVRVHSRWWNRSVDMYVLVQKRICIQVGKEALKELFIFRKTNYVVR